MKRTYISNALSSSLKLKGALLTALLALFAFVANAQVGIGTISPDGSAQLDIQATNKGLLIPRMSLSDRGTIASPATGLLIFQTDNTPGFYYYNGSAWVPLTAAAGGSAIIPYASGAPATMTTVLGGLLNSGTVLGFGASAPGITALGGFIDATSLTSNMAFSVPRDGIITSLAGTFSSSLGVALIGSTVTIQGQLYMAPAGTNIFTQVPGATVVLSPPLTGVVSIGTASSGTTTGLSIPVAAGTRLLLVFSASITAGLDIATVISGHISAGVGIN